MDTISNLRLKTLQVNRSAKPVHALFLQGRAPLPSAADHEVGARLGPRARRSKIVAMSENLRKFLEVRVRVSWPLVIFIQSLPLGARLAIVF